MFMVCLRFWLPLFICVGVCCVCVCCLGRFGFGFMLIGCEFVGTGWICCVDWFGDWWFWGLVVICVLFGVVVYFCGLCWSLCCCDLYCGLIVLFAFVLCVVLLD